MTDWKTATLGRTGRAVGRLGLAAGYGAGARVVEMAFERGVNYFYWGSRRPAGFAEGLRNLARERERFLVVLQSYSRMAWFISHNIEKRLRDLHMDYADVLLLGLWNGAVRPGVMERALELRRRGVVRYLAVSTHNRKHAAEVAAGGEIDIVHVRYNAAHPGAERDLFPLLPEREKRAGIVNFTATSWGQLLQPSRVPAGDRVPTAGDCYRFVLTEPAVDVCLTGPKTPEQFQNALDAWGRGPMSADELAWMRRVGAGK